MTDLEIATLAFQQAALSLQHWDLWASNFLAFVGIACPSLLIYYGIRKMDKANERRSADMKEQRKTDAERHKENMTALITLIERTKP